MEFFDELFFAIDARLHVHLSSAVLQIVTKNFAIGKLGN
jgi:hypothetical protein